MGAVVGIDLGTSNTVVAAMRDGNPFAIRDETGSSLIPSIVSFLPSGAILVGSAAKERRSQDIKNTVYSVKRLIGRPWDSPEVRQARSRFSFDLREGPGRATFVMARNETFTLPEISAYVLRKAKSIAEIELGETVDRAVITVPANFNDLQRAATKVAGRVAGLDILRILNEPTAAALAYGYNHGASEKIAVFDFGGGTFDMTLLSLTESVFEVLATAGNTFLGGDDLDWAIAEKMADEFLAHHGHDVRKYPNALEHIRAAAEMLKIRLADEQEVELALDVALEPNQNGLPLTFAMSRAEFDRLAAPIVDRAFDVCREALGVARVGIREIEHVLVVGGCTRLPYVRRRVEEYFKRQIDSHLDPHEVVALGAALQAYALTARPSTSRMEVPPAPLQASATLEGSGAGTEWRQKTQPFGRLGSTNIGVGPSQPPGAPTNIQVPPPDDALGGPIPTTKHLGSRGRLNTAIGIGPEVTEDPEDLLPIVADHGLVGGGPVDDGEDEATRIRPPLETIEDAELPMRFRETHQSADAQLSDDITVRVQKAQIDSLLMHSEEPSPPKQETDADLPTRPQDVDLPAVAEASPSGSSRSNRVPNSTANRSSSKTPSADELRQRYGDLPLIIGGKRMGTRPPTGAANPEDLPLVRPTLDTIVDTGEPKEADELPILRVPTQASSYAHDSAIHAELPLVGIGTPEKKLQSSAQPTIQRPRNPLPPRVVPAPAADIPPVNKPAPTAPAIPASSVGRTGDILYSLADTDLVEEQPSQPNSVARASVRPAMRAEPIAEAALPIPNIPSQVPRPPLNDGLGGSPNMGGASPLTSSMSSPRVSSAPTPSVPQPEGLTARNDARRPTVNPHVAALAATQPLASLPSHDLASSPGKSQPQRPRFGVGVPLLIDVTPLSLCVETVGSYCDVLIDRNTPVPCERTREFVTVQDGQLLVKVRVAQGESRVFSENLLLGELELTGLRPTPRGQLKISVTFGLDSDGILHVRAIDLDTGRAATSELRLAGIPTASDLAHITARHLATS